jgi:subtilisin family serine protease
LISASRSLKNQGVQRNPPIRRCLLAGALALCFVRMPPAKPPVQGPGDGSTGIRERVRPRAFADGEGGGRDLEWFAAGLPADTSASSHPVERAVARGEVIESRSEAVEAGRIWQRVRTVQAGVQPRPVRVVERWERTGEGRLRCVSRDMYLADQLIVGFTDGVDRSGVEHLLASGGMTMGRQISGQLFTVRLASAALEAVPQAIGFLSRYPGLVSTAAPDGVGFGAGIPSDSNFGNQWGHHNTGQSGGTAGADVDALEFWDIIGDTPGMVVAVLDSGMNLGHPDLQNLSWINPGEVAGDGIDNDANGKVDDIAGWDFVDNDNNPDDDHGHGSNVTGILAATRNNATGIAGMIGGVRILVCKILNSQNSGLTSDLIAAVAYSRQLGVPVMNLSLQNYPLDSSLNNEFNACQSAGILLSICAGNQGVNNDTTPNYPSCYPHPNIIAVGNHDRTDVRWSGNFGPSNYGLATVDLFAPGREIVAPVLGTGYSFFTGTSQATPYVTAVCAAIKYANPSWSADLIKASVLASVVTRPAYSGVCSSGGRLNAANAMGYAIRQLPDRDSDGDGHANLLEYLAGTRVDAFASRPALIREVAGGYFKLGMPRVLRADAALELQVSDDLKAWTTLGITDFSSSEQLLGGIPLAGSGQRFLRIHGKPSP